MTPDPPLDIVRPVRLVPRATPPTPREEALTALRGELARLDADLNTKRRQRDDLDEMISLLAQGRITAKEALGRMTK